MEDALEIESILKSDQLSSKEKSMLLDSYWDDNINNFRPSSVDLKEKTQHTEAITKDVISERHESPSHSSPEQPKPRGALDTLIIDEITSILKSDLTWEDKTAAFATILFDNQDTISPSTDKTTTTLQQIEQQGKNPDSDEKTDQCGYGDDKLVRKDGTSEKLDDSPKSHSSPQVRKIKADVDPEPELKLINNEKDIPPPEDDTSGPSSKLEVQVIDRSTYTKASTQVAPGENCRILLETEVFTVKESESNSDGKENETIHKQEAACKHCYKLVPQESRVFKAKCGCTSSLIHEDCASVWSQQKGTQCSHCEQQIQNTSVMLHLIPLQTGEQNSETSSSTSKRFWCCFA